MRKIMAFSLILFFIFVFLKAANAQNQENRLFIAVYEWNHTTRGDSLETIYQNYDMGVNLNDIPVGKRSLCKGRFFLVQILRDTARDYTFSFEIGEATSFTIKFRNPGLSYAEVPIDLDERNGLRLNYNVLAQSGFRPIYKFRDPHDSKSITIKCSTT